MSPGETLASLGHVNLRAHDWLVCPLCAADLRVGTGERAADDLKTGSVRCGGGHVFPIVRGVPRLLADRTVGENDDARSIEESFSQEWGHFEYHADDRTWGQDVEERLDDFLRMIDRRPEWLEGRRVLDAGCGNGVLSHAIGMAFACDVLAADLSQSVEGAHRHFAARGPHRTHYIQANLMRPPFRAGTFDVVFCAGVLHHTPDTRRTLEGILGALAPGGTIFIWLYSHIPGARWRFKLAARSLISRLPSRLQHAIVTAMLPQAMLRQHLRTILGRNDFRDRLKWRERLVILLDYYTPRFRWEHSSDEVHNWFRELGLTDIKTTEVGPYGFGVAASLAADRGAAGRPLVTA